MINQIEAGKHLKSSYQLIIWFEMLKRICCLWRETMQPSDFGKEDFFKNAKGPEERWLELYTVWEIYWTQVKNWAFRKTIGKASIEIQQRQAVITALNLEWKSWIWNKIQEHSLKYH